MPLSPYFGISYNLIKTVAISIKYIEYKYSRFQLFNYSHVQLDVIIGSFYCIVNFCESLQYRKL